ncbi:hypothetical protein DV113_000116 [Geotrichum candidum]|uniref:Similar to Saccharomyces cerevisiae YLR023C IZH3 Membrane protein involved in zinc ion homeostasis, member of the four-protein IZH family n=1 Tax=Geotrichum candidum TaxID=1173061 RepID=A0A0J9XCR3_GEOCN|nr:hypothetical protein DV454_004639 [Geotrichum candidum]KAF7501783.1 hypothetical protein DV113_000116 [Geotrichum candidum]KAI8134570.1 hypothetical protein DUD61_001719 [Geotrichum candidum]CDO54631.1 similar to Saccharomyces cerevisiae YLR023C IZH3 Membrane protein involved in zinc ion homeostasis, member of the four-protein IZH family [Geotrichum candidum]
MASYSTSSSSTATATLVHRKPASDQASDSSSGAQSNDDETLSQFLKDLEDRLRKLEDDYGFSGAIDQVDESIYHTYKTLVEVRDSMIGEGKKAADSLVTLVASKYQELPSLTTLESNLLHLEKNLVDLEQFCLENSILAANHLNKSIQSALSAAATRLLTYEEIPTPWRCNPYIKRGYRFCHNYFDCVVSMAKIHNETCNIWTHLLGFVAMLTIAFFHWPTTLSWQESSNMDKFAMLIFLVAAMKCLACSAVWHTFNGICHEEHMKRFACVDYTGITVLIACSILTTEYTAFYCSPRAQAAYMIVTALCGLAGAIFTWHPSFDRPDGKARRVTFFVSFAVAGGAGFMHAAALHGFTPTFFFYLPVLKSLASYSVGVIVYALLIPERWCPGGLFDYFGMSHNLWHISVFAGIYYHYMATVSLLEGAKAYSCSA